MARQTIFIALAALVLRLFLIFPGLLESKVEMLTNKADLRNYYWSAQTALRGENPYALWASGQSNGYRADMAPLELAIYVGTITPWNDPRAIQVLFALSDALNIGLLGVLLTSSPVKLSFQIFYAFGPLVLYDFTLVPQDKTILLLLTFLLFCLLLRRERSITFYVLRLKFQIARSTLIIVTAALIAAFKWLSVFYLLPLLLLVSRDAREFVKNGVIFVGVVALTHLPWFPSWGYVYVFRSTRLLAPFHISPGVLLNALGIYKPALVFGILAISLLAIYILYWRRRIDIFEAIVSLTMAGILWTPDMDPVHLSLIVLSFLLIINWVSPVRVVAVWALSFLVSAIYAITTHEAFGSFSTAGLQEITGAYASPQMIVLSYSLLVAVFAFYLWDKLRGRAVGRAVMTEGFVREREAGCVR